ncbi:MAG: RluA family pseudouridine synthase [Bacteroidia bacterium]|jgi:23S rRNA pseudouridine1911/1915/1917 synthase|nr:RluA family pseudouridine synthase [Bacteroidia bacterium]
MAYLCAMFETDELPDAETGSEQEMYEHHRFRVDPGQELLRIDKYLMHKLASVSRTKIQAAADAGNILVNDKAIKPSYKVKPLDNISILLPHPPKVFELLAEDIPLNIVFEDDTLIILNKPPGLVVHPGYGNYTGTLVNGLLWHFEHLPPSSHEQRPGLVHRLDKDTSGIMVVAKTEYALAHLARQFYDRTNDRRYLALVWGDFDTDQGTVEGHIGRSRRDRKVMDVYPDGSEGKPAVTHWKVVERLGYVTLVECKLETGRTHQIRAHMQHIGHPLFNDATYGGAHIVKGTSFSKYRQFIDNCFAACPRQALHARSLGIKHPVTKQWMQFDSELPADIQAVIAKWRTYSTAHKFEGDPAE